MLGVKKTKKNYVKSLVFGPSAQAGAKQITKLGVHRESMGIYGHLMMLNGDLMMFNGDLMVLVAIGYVYTFSSGSKYFLAKHVIKRLQHGMVCCPYN